MIDGHIHYTSKLMPEQLEQMIQRQRLSGAALLCLPYKGRGTEADAFAFQAFSSVPVYVFGGIPRAIYSLPETDMSEALVEAVKTCVGMGCVGMKMLEGKPQVRKAYPVPDFDLPVWDAYWSFMEKEELPFYFHVNDPEEFWDIHKISKHALDSGWLYDKTFVNNEAQYIQVMHVLERHPSLHVVFPHFFFLSGQLERLSGILDTYRNVRIDVTPGIELYYQLSQAGEKASEFFKRYQDRILYGTDIGAGETVREKDEPLDQANADSRMKLITGFLETRGAYTLRADGLYVKEGPTEMMGLGLRGAVLDKVYEKNFLRLIGNRQAGRLA